MFRLTRHWCPQDPILVPLLFLIFINNSAESSKSNLNLFAENTSVFTLVKILLNLRINLITGSFNWKCLSILILWNKELNFFLQKTFLQKVFSKNLTWFVTQILSLIITLFSTHCRRSIVEEHLMKLNFKRHINKKLCKAKKDIGISCHYIARSVLLIIYKTIICTHLDYVSRGKWTNSQQSMKKLKNFL